MKPVILVLILAAATIALATPYLSEDNKVKQEATSGVLAQVIEHIKAIIKDLQNAANEAGGAIANINADIEEKIKVARQKLTENVQNMKGRVQEAIQDLMMKFSTSEGLIIKCFDSHRKEAEQIFNETHDNTMACVNQRTSEVTSVLNNLKGLGENSSELALQAMDDMQKCTAADSILSTGSCLGKVALTTEFKAATFIAGVGVHIARLNLAMGTFPAALEICAANRLVEAGLNTGKVLMEIGGCSATNIFSLFSSSTPKHKG